MTTHESPNYEYRRSADQDAAAPVRHPLVVVGAGPVGLSAAIDAATHGIPVVVLDRESTLSVGSRAICFAKRALEIFDRLGCGQPMVDKGVTWNVGRVFFGDEEVYDFNLLPEDGHRRPAFINLQQYYVEEYLVDRVQELDDVDLRWCNEVVGVLPGEEGVRLKVQTPEGPYEIECDDLIVADGARSPLRHMLGLESKGQIFKDRFLIADVKMKADFPTERWFWFNPPFHQGQSTLLHRQADNVWRIDFQLGWDADPDEETKPERVVPRIKAMLGEDAEFDLEWVSIYTFQCRRMDSFRYGEHVFFMGDAAHQVSPFGARGANSGIQDADNLIWKLALVRKGLAGPDLLDTYDAERVFAADENILNSTRSTDFITPKCAASRALRDATLMLSRDYPFARKLVNSGRLSVPAVLTESTLNTADEDTFGGPMVPGAPCLDAPVNGPEGNGWFLDYVGNEFRLLFFADDASDLEPALPALKGLLQGAVPVRPVVISSGEPPAVPEGFLAVRDTEGWLAKRYDARPGTAYLVRPDQHVAGRWRILDADRVRAALAKALGGAEIREGRHEAV